MPAYSNYVLAKGYDAEGAIAKNSAVKLGTADEAVTQCSSQGEDGLGISIFEVTTDEIDLGKGASVLQDGIAEWKTASPVTKGAIVTTTAAGLCEAAGTGDYSWGRALQDGEAGDVIAVQLFVSKYIHA